MKPIAAITGIEGFTGPYMAAELERLGYQVMGISRSPLVGRDHVIADILDRDALADAVASIKPEVVVHLAGVSHVAHHDVSAIYQANILGTRNLLDALAALDSAPASVLIPSSAHVYGASSSELLTEQSLMAPFNDYAISKIASEHVARLYMDRLPIMLTRPFNYTGIGQSPSFFVAKVVDHARRGSTDLRLGNLDVERDFTDVRDLVRCYGMLIEQRRHGDVVNICSGVSTSLRTVIELASELSGVDFAVESDSGLIRSHDVDRLVGSNARFTALTGGIAFRPLRETLQWMIEE